MATVVVSRVRGTGPALRSRIYGEAQMRAIADGAQLLFAGVEPPGDDDAGRTVFAMSFSTRQAAGTFADSMTRGLLRDFGGREAEVILVDAWTPTFAESPALI